MTLGERTGVKREHARKGSSCAISSGNASDWDSAVDHLPALGIRSAAIQACPSSSNAVLKYGRSQAPDGAPQAKALATPLGRPKLEKDGKS